MFHNTRQAWRDYRNARRQHWHHIDYKPVACDAGHWELRAGLCNTDRQHGYEQAQACMLRHLEWLATDPESGDRFGSSIVQDWKTDGYVECDEGMFRAVPCHGSGIESCQLTVELWLAYYSTHLAPVEPQRVFAPPCADFSLLVWIGEECPGGMPPSALEARYLARSAAGGEGG